MKRGPHIWNKEHHVGPIFTTKGKSGPNLTIGLSGCIEKKGKIETKVEVGIVGGGKDGTKTPSKGGKLTPTRSKHL
jgi:hypothetical protein